MSAARGFARLPGGAAEALLAASVLAAPWYFGSAPDTARYALAAALLVAGAAWSFRRAAESSGLPEPAGWAALLLAPPLVQLLFGRSSAPIRTAEALLLLLALLAAFLVAAEAASDRLRAPWLAGAVLVACGAQAAFGAVQWSLGPGLLYGRRSDLVTMPFGSYVNHNHFAGLLEMGALLALGMAFGHARLRGGPTPPSLALVGMAAALAATQLASQSRGGLVALTAGALLLALMAAAARRSSRRLALLRGGLAALAFLALGLAAVAPSARARLATLLSGPGDGSASYRLDVAGATLRLFAAHPALGSGLGAYADAAAAMKRGHGEVRTEHAESDLLELLAETGLLGALAAAGFGFGLARPLLERLRSRGDPFRLGLTLGAAAGAGALAVHSVFDFNLRIPANALVLAVLLGIVAARPAPARSLGRRAPAVALGALLLIAAVAAGWRASGARELQEALRERDPSLRVGRLEPVLRRHPYSPEALRARGVAWRDLAGSAEPLRAGRLGRAEKDLLGAVRLRPLWGEAWAELAWVHALRGETALAEQEFGRAVALDPTHPGIAAAQARFRKQARTSIP